MSGQQNEYITFCCVRVNVGPTKWVHYFLLCPCQCLANKMSTSHFTLFVSMSGQQNEYIIVFSVCVSVWPTKRVHHLLLRPCQCLPSKMSTSPFALSVSMSSQHNVENLHHPLLCLSSQQNEYITFYSVRVNVWPTKRAHHLLLCPCQCLANKTSTSPFALSVSMSGQQNEHINFCSVPVNVWPTQCKEIYITFCSVRVSGQCDFHGADGPVCSWSDRWTCTSTRHKHEIFPLQ